MSSTVTVRGSGGAIFEMDVPTAGRALAQWNEQLAKGDIIVISTDEAKPADGKPAPVRKRAAKSDKDSTPDTEE